MKNILLDFSLVFNKASAHSYVASKLSFPRWYGRNFDALNDCLWEIGECTLVLRNVEKLNEIDKTFLEVFKRNEKENKNLSLVILDEGQ